MSYTDIIVYRHQLGCVFCCQHFVYRITQGAHYWQIVNGTNHRLAGPNQRPGHVSSKGNKLVSQAPLRISLNTEKQDTIQTRHLLWRRK